MTVTVLPSVRHARQVEQPVAAEAEPVPVFESAQCSALVMGGVSR